MILNDSEASCEMREVQHDYQSIWLMELLLLPDSDGKIGPKSQVLGSKKPLLTVACCGSLSDPRKSL